MLFKSPEWFSLSLCPISSSHPAELSHNAVYTLCTVGKELQYAVSQHTLFSALGLLTSSCSLVTAVCTVFGRKSKYSTISSFFMLITGQDGTLDCLAKAT